MSRIKVLEDYKVVPVEELKIGKKFQRDINNARLSKIEKSIKKYGYLPHEPLKVDADGYVTDGQHRLTAAKRLGIKHVPVTVYGAETYKDEVKFFMDMNSFNTNLSSVDTLAAAYEAGEPAAKIIYELEKDTSSKLYERIALRGKGGLKNRFSLTAVSSLINTVVFNLNAPHWKSKDNEKFQERLEQQGYGLVLSRVNEFLTWFYSFAEDKQTNPFAYRLATFRAILRIYLSLKHQGFLSARKEWNSSVNKLAKFNFADPVFNSADWRGQTVLLGTHINKNKKKVVDVSRLR